MAKTRTSLSVYRGQSRRGIGEGPGRPVLHGEQYLAASPELAQDGDLLDAIRPWMSLDSDPEDHQRLGDRLEAWSCFRYRDLGFVVRLISAGTYDRRAAYFSHGRAWPVDPSPGFDPGLYLGRSEAFESSWRDDDPGRRVPEPAPALVRPDQIAAEPETAKLFLAQFFQSCVRQRPLILACPVAEFAAGAPLHALVSFARGALPADLRSLCRIRIYTRTPELFLRSPGAALAAVPEEMAGRALGVRREATLIDRQGKALAGEPLEPMALAYAEAVIERALRIPEGLTVFTERFRGRRSRSGLPDERDVRAIQVTYNLAVALAGSAGERDDLLRNYLPRIAHKLGSEVDWQHLIAPEDWQTFPQEPVLDLLLMDSQALSAGTRGLQRAVEQSAARLGLKVDDRLANWGDVGETAKLRRLLDLAAQRPPLVSASALAERTVSLPIRHIADFGGTELVLTAELESGVLHRREAESAELGKLASSPGVLRILLQAVESEAFGPGWARTFLENSDGIHLSAVAPEFLRARHLFDSAGPWKEIPTLLLDKLRRQGVPRELAPMFLQAGMALDPVANLPVFLRLADLVARIDERQGILVARLWRELPRLQDAGDRELLVQAALSGEWRCLQPSSLADQGRLRQPWLEAMAPRLVAYEDLLRALGVSALLRLADHLDTRKDLEQVFDFVDSHLSGNPRAAIDVLIREGWWGGWRKLSRLATKATVARRAAVAWLTSRSWTENEREATFEDWQRVMADLPQDLSAGDMAALWDGREPRRLWPWIPPFEEDQLKDLIEKGSDLIALAELTEALLSDPSDLNFGERNHRYVLRHSRFNRELHEDALGWLLAPESRGELSALDLRSSLKLVQYAGTRADRALQAKLLSILECLKKNENAPEAIRAAGKPSLWGSPQFLGGLAAWMAQRGSVQQIGKELLPMIDGHVAGEPAPYPKQVPPSLVRQLTKQGYKKAARLLSPDLSRKAEKENLVQSVLDAMIDGSRGHGCWKELTYAFDRSALSRAEGPNPLSSVAAEVRQLPQERWRPLWQHGWSTFEAAAQDYPSLMDCQSGEPASLPAFELAASLSEPGGVGRAAWRVIRSAESGYRARSEWWGALLIGLSTWRRYSALTDCPDDRRDVALALVVQVLDDLAAGERHAFWAAWQQHIDQFPESDSLLERETR